MFKKVKKDIGSKRTRQASFDNSPASPRPVTKLFQAPPSKRFNKGISTSQLLVDPDDGANKLK